jgi:hypothetical protein
MRNTPQDYRETARLLNAFVKKIPEGKQQVEYLLKIEKNVCKEWKRVSGN